MQIWDDPQEVRIVLYRACLAAGQLLVTHPCHIADELTLGQRIQVSPDFVKGLVQPDALTEPLKQPLMDGSVQPDGFQLEYCLAIDKGHLRSSLPDEVRTTAVGRLRASTQVGSVPSSGADLIK